MPGIIVHGLAHFFISTVDPAHTKGGPPIFGTVPLSLLVQGLGVIFIFFFFLYRAMGLSVRAAMANSVLHGSVNVLLIPPRFGFTHVQTALMFVSATHELRRAPELKDRYWDAYALMVSLPVGFVGWAEALLCEAGYRYTWDSSISPTT